MSLQDHRQHSPDSVKCAIITISDTRDAETDKTGQYLRSTLVENNYKVVDYKIIKDQYDQIQQTVKLLSDDPHIQAILLNGGTGIALKDYTYEAVRDLLEKEMPGFGELFRYLSYAEQIGSAAILSRAIAGAYNHTAVFSMPGSVNAARLALEKIIIPELPHVVYEISKDIQYTKNVKP